MTNNKVEKGLIRIINNHLSCFGPFRCGPNILINLLLSKEKSLLNVNQED